ncbi:hypothetical protein [Carboxylicivirga linearis]|uniref:Uncharacterized protein n=1 Tax=Carboxylicivirga linearis TaxID=1628157 RepID=A0ABS5JUV1_9BACT|nr:hypothetical protein [Carboxylicivirga linearis]MBS2098677.1 hypothetical protein [Carboxylicivirga linearis]
METIIIILFILATLVFGIQLSFFSKPGVLLAWLSIVGIYTWGMHTVAIEQSYDLLRSHLQNNDRMIDFVVFLVIDAILGALLAIYMIRNHYGEKVKRFFKFSIYFPGLIVFPALFYFESLIYLNISGIDFKVMAIAIAIIFIVAIGGVQLLFRKSMPEVELRIEMKFFMHIFQLMGAIILSIKYLGLPVTKSPDHNIYSFEYIFILVAVVAIIALGVVWKCFQIKRKITHL